MCPETFSLFWRALPVQQPDEVAVIDMVSVFDP